MSKCACFLCSDATPVEKAKHCASDVMKHVDDAQRQHRRLLEHHPKSLFDCGVCCALYNAEEAAYLLHEYIGDAPAGDDRASDGEQNAEAGNLAQASPAVHPTPAGACALHERRGYCDAEAWFKGKGEGYSEAIEEFADDVARAVQAERARAVGIIRALQWPVRTMEAEDAARAYLAEAAQQGEGE